VEAVQPQPSLSRRAGGATTPVVGASVVGASVAGAAVVGASVVGVAVVLAGVCAYTLWWRPLRRLEVEGASMRPTLEPGDRLVVRRAGRRRVYRPGELVAVRDPRRPGRLLVKRVAAVGPEGLDVRGDNPAESTDSRQFGPVGHRDVVGVVVHRYGPARRGGSTLG
jgi:nickel-type superoxide dismutase maturation protease